MMAASGAAAEITAVAVPLLPYAHAMVERGAIPGGTKRNLTSLAEDVSFAASVGETERVLLADAQTSGGLLIAVPADRADALVTALQRERTPAAEVIGRVVVGPPGSVRVA